MLLRSRGLEVHVVAQEEEVPMRRVLGPEIGRSCTGYMLHMGWPFHLGYDGWSQLEGRRAICSSTERRSRSVWPCRASACGRRSSCRAGRVSAIDRGVSVDEYLQTTAPGIFAAGDIARWPDPHSGEKIRVEHWALAQRQGQVAALNMLGHRQRFDAVPFFWSLHYDVAISTSATPRFGMQVEIDGALDPRQLQARATWPAVARSPS